VFDKCLRLLFDHVGAVAPTEAYVRDQMRRVLGGRVNLQNFVFAREFRGRHAYRHGAHIAALKLAE
jgi:DNA polymerase zeta